MLELPRQLLTPDNPHRHIDLEGCTVVESCFYDDKLQDSAYLSEHEIIHIISGRLIVKGVTGEQNVEAGETLLMRKGAYFEFVKLGRLIGEDYKSVLFFLQNEFIKAFIRTYQLEKKMDLAVVPDFVMLPKNEMLKGFLHSLIPYFTSPLGNKKELFRLKTYELLFNIAELQPELFSYFFHLANPVKADLVEVMENHFTKNLPIEGFAHLSGRSLATFKRDFRQVFNTSPAKWLKKKRLELSHYLLLNTDKKPTEVYMEVGFEDYAHFSRSFKSYYAISPSRL